VGSDYYVCGTQRGGFEIFSSKNLRDWRSVGNTGQGGCAQCWAPNFMAYKGRIFMTFTDGASMTTSVAVADKVTGPYKIVCAGGVPGIDGYLYAHGDGTVWCFYNPIKRGAIMAVAKMSADLSRVESSKDLFTGPVPGLRQAQITVEAPVCTRVGGLLYLSYSISATGPDYNLSYATGTSPLGPWKQSGTVLLPADKTGHGHHDIVQTPKGTFVCVYHGASGTRNLCVDRMTIGGGVMKIDYHAPGKPAPLIT
jgi:beta-xylosidase